MRNLSLALHQSTAHLLISANRNNSISTMAFNQQSPFYNPVSDSNFSSLCFPEKRCDDRLRTVRRAGSALRPVTLRLAVMKAQMNCKLWQFKLSLMFATVTRRAKSDIIKACSYSAQLNAPTKHVFHNDLTALSTCFQPFNNNLSICTIWIKATNKELRTGACWIRNLAVGNYCLRNAFLRERVVEVGGKFAE